MLVNSDKFPSQSQHKTGRRERCLNCHEHGHRARNCYRPPTPKCCYMCGEKGHLEPKCPNTICLNVSIQFHNYIM